MIHLRRPRLPATTWTPPFVLVLVALMVQIYVLIFVGCVSLPVLQGDFVRSQWFMGFWTAEGALKRGLPFGLMMINILLVVYLWATCRALDRRRGVAQRLGHLGAAVVLAILQLLWAKSYDLARPRFTLIPFPM